MHSFQFGMLFFLKNHSQPDNIILEISPSITSLCSTPILWGHVLSLVGVHESSHPKRLVGSCGEAFTAETTGWIIADPHPHCGIVCGNAPDPHVKSFHQDGSQMSDDGSHEHDVICTGFILYFIPCVYGPFCWTRATIYCCSYRPHIPSKSTRVTRGKGY